MDRPLGNLLGLKHQQVRQLERLYRRRVPPAALVTPELARQLAEISRDLRRQVGVLVDRAGQVSYVIVGDAKGLLIPSLPRERGTRGRLKAKVTEFMHPEGVFMLHGFGKTVPAQSRCYGKGASDALIQENISDKAGGSPALDETLVTVRPV